MLCDTKFPVFLETSVIWVQFTYHGPIHCDDEDNDDYWCWSPEKTRRDTLTTLASIYFSVLDWEEVAKMNHNFCLPKPRIIYMNFKVTSVFQEAFIWK